MRSGRTIAYTYDPLYRLTAANYNNGTYFRYTYDAVGHRLTQTTITNTTVYTYDIANRLINAGGVAYRWDNNIETGCKSKPRPAMTGAFFSRQGGERSVRARAGG